ncbi:hypothetical protein PIROE2DRAFT_15496 [Piromyces sp. E2]|nr:hypothetical protein PIROE2DRAFT_15496 [Piromyces sp. E2]|eukprot:OUM59082.1 hypothetical protein PIROE2DRAFT_15496 [Piromyces sp. E2]
MDQYSRGYNPNWYSHKYSQDNKGGNNSKINKNSYDLKSKSDYNYYNRSNSKSNYNERNYDYNNGNIGLSRDSKDRVKYYEPESTSNQWSTSSNSSNTSNRNSYYRSNQRLSTGISMKKMESLTSEQSLPRSNSVPKLNSQTLGYFKTPNRIDVNPHSRTYTSEKYYDEKSKENYLPSNNSKIPSENVNKFDQEFPALGATKKTEPPKYSRPYSLNYSSIGSNSNNNSLSSNNTWSNTSSQASNNGYKSYNSIVNNRLSNGNSNLNNANNNRPWDKKSSNYDSPQSQRTDSTVSSPYENSNSTLSSIVSQSIKNNGLSSNNYSNNNYSNDNSYNNQNSSIGNTYNGSNSNSLSSTPTPISAVSVNGGFAAAAAVSSTTNTNVESSNFELMKLRQLVPKVNSQSSRSKSNYSRVKGNQTRPLATQNRRSTTPVGLKISLSSDVINGISSSKLHTSAPSSPKSSNNSSSTPVLTAKHKNKSSSKFFKELRKLGLSNNSKTNQEDKNDNNSEISDKSATATIKESEKYKTDNSELSEKNTATIMDNTDTSSEDNVLEEEEKLRNNNEEIIISETKESEEDISKSEVLNIPIQESHNKIKSSREKYFAVPYSASLEKEEQFMTSLGWNKQQYGYEDSDVEDGEWEITDEEKIKFYNIFNNDCKNIFKSLEPKTKNNVTRKCLECSTCFACPFPCTICGSILLESGGLNNRMIHLHKHSKNNPSLLSQISTIDDSLTDSEDSNSLEDKDTTSLSGQNSSKENEIKQHHHVCQIHNEHHYKNEQNQVNANDEEEIFELK